MHEPALKVVVEEKRVDEELSYRSQSTVKRQEPGSPEFYSLNESDLPDQHTTNEDPNLLTFKATPPDRATVL